MMIAIYILLHNLLPANTLDLVFVILCLTVHRLYCVFGRNYGQFQLFSRKHRIQLQGLVKLQPNIQLGVHMETRK